MDKKQNPRNEKIEKIEKKNKSKRIYLFILIACIAISSISLLVLQNKKGSNSDGEKIKNFSSQSTTENNKKIKAVSTANILNTGDMLIHIPILNGAKKSDGVYDFSKSFTYVKNFVSKADFSVCNLETTLSGKEKSYSGYPLFNSPDSFADALKGAGFDLILTSNNHSYDRGSFGLKRTLQVLDKKNIAHTGSRIDETVKPYVVKEVNGIKIGFINYTYETKQTSKDRKSLNGNPVALEATNLINSFNYDKLDEFYSDVKTKISDMKKDGAEAIMFYIHWGTEYQTTPNSYQKTIAKKMCDLGVDVLVGGHPHVIQPVEVIKGEKTNNKMACIYSTGNAISNQRVDCMNLKSGHTEDGILFYANFTKYSDGKVKLTKIDYIPTWVNVATIDGKKVHQIIPLNNIMNSTKNLGLNTQTAKQAKKSYERTKSLVGSGIEEFNNLASNASNNADIQTTQKAVA